MYGVDGLRCLDEALELVFGLFELFLEVSGLGALLDEGFGHEVRLRIVGELRVGLVDDEGDVAVLELEMPVAPLDVPVLLLLEVVARVANDVEREEEDREAWVKEGWGFALTSTFLSLERSRTPSPRRTGSTLFERPRDER